MSQQQQVMALLDGTHQRLLKGLDAAGDRSGWPVRPLPSYEMSCPCPGPLPADGLEEASSSRRGDAQGDGDASATRLDGARAVVPTAEPSVVYEYDAELIERKCAARPAPAAGCRAASPVVARVTFCEEIGTSPYPCPDSCRRLRYEPWNCRIRF